ncbi:hypothetical protein BH09VER1_BH09VER1_42180 [soil metagenome]
MKLRASSPRNLLRCCALIIIVNFALFQLMASTHMIEKIMAFNFQWWDMLLVLFFLAFRLTVYLIVPPALVALCVYLLAKRFGRPSSNPEIH